MRAARASMRRGECTWRACVRRAQVELLWTAAMEEEVEAAVRADRCRSPGSGRGKVAGSARAHSSYCSKQVQKEV